MNEWVPARCRQWLTNREKEIYTISPIFLFDSSTHLCTYLAKLAAREKHYLWKLFLKLWGCKMFFELLMVFKQEKYTPCAAEQNQHIAASQDGTATAWCEGLGWQQWPPSAALRRPCTSPCPVGASVCPTATALPPLIPQVLKQNQQQCHKHKVKCPRFFSWGNLK